MRVKANLFSAHFCEGVHFLVNTTWIQIHAHAVAAIREMALRVVLFRGVRVSINRPQKVCAVTKCVACEDGVHSLFMVIWDYAATKCALSILGMLVKFCWSLAIEKCLRSAGLFIR